MRKTSVNVGWGVCGVVLACAGCATTVIDASPASSARASAVARVVVHRGGTNETLTVEARAEAAGWTAGAALSQAVARVMLAPHGRWQTTSLGELWFPDVAQRETFEPFVTHGQWTDASDGPRWRSVFAWGSVAFHYGRWVRVGDAWAWKFDEAFYSAPVRWRVSGRHVGWSVEGEDRWCWLSFEGLFAPSPATRAIRGRAAAPLATSSVEYASASGWTADLRGRAPTANPSTTGAVGSVDQQTIEPTVGEDRWATVVIRDDAALDRFDEVRSFESAPSVASAPISAALAPTRAVPSSATRETAPTVARAVPRAGLWSDQDRSRAPIVANIAPRFEAFVPGVVRVEPTTAVRPSLPSAEPQTPHTNSSSPSTIPAGGAGGATSLRLAPLARTPAIVPATTVRVPSLPTLSAGSARTVR